MPQNPLDMLRDLYKTYADQHDAADRQKAQHWDGRYTFPENLPPHMVYMGEELPPVSRAPQFRPETEVRGTPEFARGIDRMFKGVPEMKGRASVIQDMPTEGALALMARSGFRPHEFGDTNLLGITNLHNRQVGINPTLDPDALSTTADSDTHETKEEFYPTVTHELSHLVGVGHDEQMRGVEKAARQSFSAPYDKNADVQTKLEAIYAAFNAANKKK